MSRNHSTASGSILTQPSSPTAPQTVKPPVSAAQALQCTACSLQQAVRHGGCAGTTHPLYPRCPPLGRSTWLQPPGAFSTLRWPKLLLQSVGAGEETGEGEEKPPQQLLGHPRSPGRFLCTLLVHGQPKPTPCTAEPCLGREGAEQAPRPHCIVPQPWSPPQPIVTLCPVWHHVQLQASAGSVCS